jgi:hypothetical protein
MVVASSEDFLRVVVSDSRTFVLNRSSREARQLGLFFERTLRSLRFEDFLVLFAIAAVFQTEQGVQAGQKLLKKLCA